MVSVFQELFCQKCLDKGMYSDEKAPQDNCKKCRKPRFFQKHLAYCEVKCTEYSPDEVIKNRHNSFSPERWDKDGENGLIICLETTETSALLEDLANSDLIFRLRPWRRPPHWPHQEDHHQQQTLLTWVPLGTCSNYWFRPIPGDTRQYCINNILIVKYNCDCNQR